MNALQPVYQLTDRTILQDFVNALLVEALIPEHSVVDDSTAQAMLDTFGFDLKQQFNNTLEQQYFVLLPEQHSQYVVIFPVQQGIAQPWCFAAESEILRVETGDQQTQIHSIELFELFECLQQIGLFQHCQDDKLQIFSAQIQKCLQQYRLLQQHQVNAHDLIHQSSAQVFRILEQYAGYRDRPYHPLSKLKEGLSQQEYLQYCPEFSQELSIQWVAVHKDKMMFGAGVEDIFTQQPSQIFINRAERYQLKQEMFQRGLSETHIAMPVHPWQFQHLFQQFFAEDIAAGICQPLNFVSKGMYASASMRSLLSEEIPEESLKLPIGIKALGSLRFLPIVKMINGEKNQKLLRQAQLKDPILQQKLWLCEETQWWSYLPEKQQDRSADNEWLFVEKLTHLAAQRRHIPVELLQQPYQLIPMASLGHTISGQPAVFDYILQLQQLQNDAAQVLEQFAKLCACFFEVNLRLFSLGLMGEIHGQNLCLVLKNGEFDGLMFRDHDSLRIYLPWVLQNGLDDPDYLSPHDFRNTLYHDSAEALLFYIQTLGIQVNLGCIVETLAKYYQIPTDQLWQILAEQLRQVLEKLDFQPEIHSQLRALLFESPNWPYKQLIRPLLEQDTRIGSMPSGIGETRNPLWHVLAQSA
ncbi:IucA/IucC family protein [Acinetobacter vivianii]|uniref:IucA/IucC family protein n=1 Tax=Acinetobacter vivianii TaxID=1776742 RepID=UPI002DB70DE8|nr:IucA/IucC family protein [Acinetobacter vivianii]MEB6478789.1 IucA/IucC family siderophore biosynthesis protein [Acinetobacter vivianii]MEB6657380.1 IucA/IucC family siderophore biosynthesis protein [Acinetobacter vivianii]